MRVDDSSSFHGSLLEIKQDREFPCGRGYDSCFHCRGLGSILGFETKILQDTGMVQTRKKKKRERQSRTYFNVTNRLELLWNHVKEGTQSSGV